MLYELYLIFDINLFKYITVRAFGGFFISLAFVLIFMPIFMKWAKKNRKQPINKYAPKNHQTKTQIPTMGGAVFLSATIVSSLLTIDLSNTFGWVGVLVVVLFGFIGIKDDMQKIFKNDNQSGMSAKTKIFFQILFALIISTIIYKLGFLTSLYVPFYKYPLLDMGVYAILFWSFVIVATSNAVNLTDGLDGLATFPSFLAFITLSIILYITGSPTLSQYLLLPTFEGISEVAILTSCFCGALIGFLWYNSHPAEVFMGDSGSLPIGAFMGYIAIISKSEILLLLIGIIFVIETISVILQVGSFKLRKKRIFLMAPLHHHFEIKGWAESKIIIRFWIIALIANLLAILTIKFR